MLRRNFIAAIVATIICDIGIVGKSHAQPLQFRHYSTDEGFTGAAFKKIVQDSLGFLWICSRSGIYKFDGYDFTNYRAIAGDSLSLPQDNVLNLWVDPSGRIWAGFPNRIAVYDRDCDGFRSYTFSTGGSEPESIYFEGDDVLWVGTQRKGLRRLTLSTGDTASYFNNSGGESALISGNTINDIKNSGEILLLGTDHGLWKFDKKRNVFERPLCDPADSTTLYKSRIKKIIRHPDHYWIWLDQQLVKCSNEFSIIQSFDLNLIKQRFDLTGDFNGPVVEAVQQDKNGTFWIVSQGLGLSVYDPFKNQLSNFRNERTDPESLPSDVLNDIMIDTNGNIWIATLPKGIVQVKKRSLKFTNHLPGTSTGRMAVLKTSGRDQLVVSSQGEGMWVCPIDSRKLDSLDFRMFELPANQGGFRNLTGVYPGSDHVWAASLTSGLMGIPIDKKHGIIKDAPVIIFRPDLSNPNTITGGGSCIETDDGHLFVASLDNGLNKVVLSAEYGRKGSVIRYLHDDNDSTSIVNNGVIDVMLQEDNSLLVATQGGLDMLKDGKFHHILKNISCTRIVGASDGTLLVGTKNGLYEGKKNRGYYSFIKAAIPGDPFVTSIREDRLGRVWFMSYEGLYFYDRNTKQSLLFKKEDGLPSSRSISGCGSVYTSDGIMIFGNAEGITFFNPLSLHINEAVPRPLITTLKINNKVAGVESRRSDDRDFVLTGNINTLRELTLDYTQNIITLEFSAMDLTAPERNQYQYQLDGFDREPVLTDWKNRSATYTNLRPGDYIFKVRASNRDGIWNDKQTELIIHVLPPPWKTWWAYSLYGIVIAGLLFLARRNIINHERLASKLALEHVELEKVQEIDRAKTDFFANISHEFRTPLTLIQGPVQNLMEKFKTDTQTTDQLMLVQQNSDRLLRLVNQILELARLESGTLKNEMSESDIILFLKKIVGSFTSFAFQKKISFIQQFPDYGIRAQFDKDKLEKITSNLISNALKFTPEQGAVIVNISVTRSNGPGELLLRVTDTGKGVPEEQMTKIFERFYQVSEDGNVNVGTGIGLALCKELAEFLGGSLTLESKVGEGSRFSLVLPLETAELINETQTDESIAILSNHVEAAPKVVIQNEDHVEKPLVLVVEDHSDLRKFIISCLGTEYSFLEASNGKEGFHHAIEQVPTLVLSDVMMPEMDGIEMCNKIKQDQRTSHIPVILLTAKASDESKLSGLGIGADDYIIKPFNKEELKLKIRNQVAVRTRMQERIRMEFLSESTTIKAVSADEKFLERLKKIVETRINDELLSVESLTEEIGMSRAQLYRKVTALTGLSGNEFIRKLRLQRAAQLLQQHFGPVSQVAYEVGFSNLSYFSKCFKEQYGVLPSEYKS